VIERSTARGAHVTSDDPGPGPIARSSTLRERKRTRLKYQVQTEALRLFAERGYDRTTVDDIAHAAAMSPRTFFRYFATKEDVVIWDEQDEMDMSEAVLRQALGDAPLRNMLTVLRDLVEDIWRADEDRLLARIKLCFEVPEIRARAVNQYFGQGVSVLAEVEKIWGVPAGDLRLRVLLASVYASIFVAAQRWAHEDGRQDLIQLIDEALGALVASVADLEAVLKATTPVGSAAESG
jgi:AcrR family transcriptional regulator